MRTVNMFACAALTAASGGTAATAQNSPSPTAAHSPARLPYRYRVLGVFDAASGEPIEGVEVSDVLTGTTALTTGTGTVSLYFLPEGGSLVRVRKLGYDVQMVPVAISPADTTPVTIILARAAPTLPTVVVNDSAIARATPRLRGFEERRTQGFGHFITETQFRKQDGKPLSYVLVQTIPGIMMTEGPHAETYIVSSRKPCKGLTVLSACKTPNCYVSIYQDGVRIYDAGMPGAPVPDFSRLSATDYEAAEYYAGGATLPPEYNATSSGCGALLLWTRER